MPKPRFYDSQAGLLHYQHTVELKFREFVSRYTVNDPLFLYADVNLIVDAAARSLVFEIRKKISSLEFKRQEVKYPSNWKEAFKERWFPKWALKRWPVEYRSAFLSAEALFYEFNNPLPGQPYQIIVVKSEDDLNDITRRIEPRRRP